MYRVIDENTRVSAPLKYEVVTPPAQEPVTYQELIDHLRLPTRTDRDLVMALAKVGRDYVEKRTRQTLITTEYDLWLDYFPPTIILPARPAQSVTFIKWIDGTGATNTLPTNRYQVDAKGTRPVIIPPLGAFFPIVKMQTPNAVQVRFKAGWGDLEDEIPEIFKLMIKQWVALNYEAREAVLMGKQPAQVPHTFGDLLNLERVWEL